MSDAVKSGGVSAPRIAQDVPKWARNPWIRIPATIATLIVMAVAFAVASGFVLNLLHAVQCAGSESLFCGHLMPGGG